MTGLLPAFVWCVYRTPRRQLVLGNIDKNPIRMTFGLELKGFLVANSVRCSVGHPNVINIKEVLLVRVFPINHDILPVGLGAFAGLCYTNWTGSGIV